jgi:hypothetical protein
MPTPRTLADRIWAGERVRVTTGETTFTIASKTDSYGFGIRGFGIIPDGRTRVLSRRRKAGDGGYKLLERWEVEAWADALTEAK